MVKNMENFKQEKLKDFTVIRNAIFRDNKLSAKAKGVACEMLSLPPTWNFSIRGLVTRFSDGEASIRSALTELENAGYLRREQVREDGKFSHSVYIVTDVLKPEKPYAENPHAVNSVADNHAQLNTKELNTNKSTTKRFIVPTTEEVREYIDEKGFSVDAERFIDYYTANGWMVGKNHMKDWKATVRNWERKNGTNLGTSYTVRGGVSENSGGTYGGSSENRERTRTKLPPMAALSNEPE